MRRTRRNRRDITRRARCVVSDTTTLAKGAHRPPWTPGKIREEPIAIYSLNLSSVGRTTHAARTAGAHVRYIARASAAPLIQSARMPAAPAAARAWLDREEQADRKNARVIDKIIMALPRELGREDWRRLVEAFADDLTAGQASWLSAIHAAGRDAGNPHVHLIVRDRHHRTGKRVAKLSDKGAVQRVRALWERHCNRALKAAGRAERIDRRSYAARGLKTLPQRHRGPHRPMERGRGSILHDRQPRDTTGQSGRLGAVSDKGDHLVPLAVARDDDIVFGQRLARGDVLDLGAKVAQPSGQAGALEERFHAEGEEGRVGMIGDGLAGEAIEPSLDATRQLEIVRMDGEDVALPENGIVQPRRQLDLPRLGRVGVPVRCVQCHPVVELVADRDREARQPVEPKLRAFFGLIVKPYVGDDECCGQPFDGVSQLLVVETARGPPHLAEGVVWRELDARGWLATAFNRFVQVGGREDNQIPVPHRRHTELFRRVYLDRDFGIAVLDRLCAAFLEGQKRIFHHVPIVAQRRIEGGHGEHVELDDISHARSVPPAPIPR